MAISTTDDGKLSVVTDNIEREDDAPKRTRGSAAKGETITIACSLAHGLRFTDVPAAGGGVKTVTFPGINDALRGAAFGILAPEGKAVLVTIAKSDWENIKRMHGREPAFTGRGGRPPVLLEMPGGKSEFKVRDDEVAEMRNGLEPVDPAKVRGVAEAKGER